MDVEQLADDLSCVVPIKAFAFKLLDLEDDDRIDFSRDMDEIQEIRGMWFENQPPVPMREFIAARLKEVALRWNLCYITD